MRFPKQVANNKKGPWYVTYGSNKLKLQYSIALCMRITRGRQHLEAPCYVTLGTFATPCTQGSSSRCCNRKDRRVIESWALLVKQTQAISLIWRFPKIRGTFLEVIIVRTKVFWGLYWGHPILGNYHICFHENHQGHLIIQVASISSNPTPCESLTGHCLRKPQLRGCSSKDPEFETHTSSRA